MEQGVHATAELTADFCFIVDDNSLESFGILPDDLLFVRSTSDFEDKKLMALKIGGTVVFRKVQLSDDMAVLVPGNMREAAIICPVFDHDDVRVVGVVTESRRSY